MPMGSPSKVDQSESERLNLQKYAEKLKVSLKKINTTYSVRYDKEQRIIDVTGGKGKDWGRLATIRECDSTRLKDAYCALSLQCFGDFESWRRAIAEDLIQSYDTVLTP